MTWMLLAALVAAAPVSTTGDSITVAHRAFPTHWVGVGADICPSFETGQRHYLRGTERPPFEVTPEELRELVALPMPLREGADLRFSFNADAGD